MVRVWGLAQVFEVGEGVFHEPFVERAEVGGTVTEGILTDEVVEVPVDELPVEAVVVGNEVGTPFAVGGNPGGEPLHHGFGVVELERCFAAEAADGKRLRNPLLGDGFQLAVERFFEGGFDDDGTKADHGIIAWYRPIGFNIDHEVAHRMILSRIMILSIVDPAIEWIDGASISDFGWMLHNRHCSLRDRHGKRIRDPILVGKVGVNEQLSL